MQRRFRTSTLSLFAVAAVAAACSACSGGSGTGASASIPQAAAADFAAGVTSLATGSGALASAATSLATAYRSAKWASNVTVAFPTACTMRYTTTGVPLEHAEYYLEPPSAQYPDAVAETPVTHTKLALVPYAAHAPVGATVTVNVCPAKAARTTVANQGPIGYLISGLALFNPYEGDGSTPAMSDNVSYAFKTAGGAKLTAAFIDVCNSHGAPQGAGAFWHYHGVSGCVTEKVDVVDGPSHLIGFALDGFPVYGGRDIAGKAIPVSKLDACNGITSATPEFPKGIYHYVLPLGVKGSRSSLTCYTGTVTRGAMADAEREVCDLMQAARYELLAALPRRRRAG